MIGVGRLGIVALQQELSRVLHFLAMIAGRIQGILWILLLVTACSPSHETARSDSRRVLRFTTGSPGAGFQPLGAALARAYLSMFPDLDVRLFESPGSVRNVEAIQRGEADIGFAFADVAYVAFVGQLADVSFHRLRGIAVLQLNPLHLVARSTSQIRSVRDLRGRRVGMGPPGSGTALTASLILRAFGIDPDSVTTELLQFNDASSKLISGQLDAVFVNAGYPAESVTLATGAGAKLLAIDGPAIDRLRHDYPFLRLTSIPAATYPFHSTAVHTVGVDNLLVCRSDLDETMVHDLTKALFVALPQLASDQVSLRLMDISQAPATPIPLHDGAARYYRERELFR
jgi:TRAP transporter TAXI family solute receptor